MSYLADERLSPGDPLIFSAVMLSVFIVLVFFTARKKAVGLLDYDASLMLRGIAVILLLMGHLSGKVLSHPALLRLGGLYAVVIFIFISANGVLKKYGFDGTGGGFWAKRLTRLAGPLWISLAMFFLLDLFLLGRKYTLLKIVLPFLGFHLADYGWVNPSAWFVGFILFQYLIYYLLSNMKAGKGLKITLFFIVSFFLMFAIHLVPALNGLFKVWKSYLLIFPSAVFFSLYFEARLGQLSGGRAFYIFLTAALFLITSAPEFKYYIYFKPFMFLLVVVFFAKAVSLAGYESGFLRFLGKYSYEIYLLHFPFMVKYDFILHRGPVYVSFFVYFAFIVLLAVALSAVAAAFNARIIPMLMPAQKKA